MRVSAILLVQHATEQCVSCPSRRSSTLADKKPRISHRGPRQGSQHMYCSRHAISVTDCVHQVKTQSRRCDPVSLSQKIRMFLDQKCRTRGSYLVTNRLTQTIWYRACRFNPQGSPLFVLFYRRRMQDLVRTRRHLPKKEHPERLRAGGDSRSVPEEQEQQFEIHPG